MVLAKAYVAIATTPLPTCHSRKHSPVNLWHASFLISLFPWEPSPVYHSHCDYYMSGEKCPFYSLSLCSVRFICYSSSNFTFIQLLSSEKQTDLGSRRPESSFFFRNLFLTLNFTSLGPNLICKMMFD